MTVNDINSTINGHKENWRFRPVYDETQGYDKTAEELGWTGITWNGYKLPNGLRITD